MYICIFILAIEIAASSTPPPTTTASEKTGKKDEKKEERKEEIVRKDATEEFELPDSGKEHMNVVFIGHVDAGKSTMGGHIL